MEIALEFFKAGQRRRKDNETKSVSNIGTPFWTTNYTQGASDYYVMRLKVNDSYLKIVPGPDNNEYKRGKFQYKLCENIN